MMQQLCPYCEAVLNIPNTGDVFSCGACGKAFRAEDTDSDYEDVRLVRVEKTGDYPVTEVSKTIKAGARHSKNDMNLINTSRTKLREIDAALVELGAQEDEPETPEETTEPEAEPEMMDAGKMVWYGDTVKALGDGKVAGYLVRFTTAKDPDLTGEYFTADTDFGEAKSSPVLYHHGMDAKVGKRKLGAGDMRKDDIGVWIEAQLEMRDEYEKAIYEMAQAGKLGWSSGTAGHLVERDHGKITRWPLGLDASLTPTPAEPRNGAVPLKSLIPSAEALLSVAAVAEITVKSIGVDKMEFTQEQIEAMVASAASKAVEAYQKAEPPTVKAGGNVSIVKDEADQPFKSAGEFFQAVKNAALYPSRADVRLSGLKATGMSEGVPADGGYLLQEQYAAGLIERMYNNSQVMSAVNMMNIGPNSNSVTMFGVDETSRVDGSRWGGIRGYWLAEGGTKTASKPAFRQLELKLKKVAALAYATDELLGDATALESWLQRTVPEELRFKVEDAVINGDGVGKPLGIMNSGALISVLRYATSAINYVDVINLWARRYPGYNDYVWYINTDVAPQLNQMVLSGSTEIPLRFVDFDSNGTMRMFGRPVVEVEYCQTLGTTGDIILASMGQYQMIQKGGIETASSIHVQFLTDETVFRFVYRTDGQSLWHSALTPFKGSNTHSPFVCLTTATA